MGVINTYYQNNVAWSSTWKPAGRYPIIADRIFESLSDAQAYVDDTRATASATVGLILSVIKDEEEKNNGVYYVQAVANTDEKYGDIVDKGVLVRVGTDPEVAADVDIDSIFDVETEEPTEPVE